MKGDRALPPAGALDVTVVIPTRNRVAFLSGALQSALSQVGVSYEIRVVDDASDDGTAELLEGCRDGRVKTARHDASRGVAAARNRAAGEARGEWLAFLDDDDLWAPTWLRAGLRTARMRNVGLVYGSRWIIDDRRRVSGALLAPPSTQVRGLLAGRNSLGGPSAVMVRADVLAAAGGFDERVSALADWDAWLRVLDLCEAAPVPEILTAYTRYPGNMHISDPLAVLAEFEILARLVKIRGGSTKALNEGEFIKWLALDCGRAGHRRMAAGLWLRCAQRTRKPEAVLRAGMILLRGEPSDCARFASPGWLAALSPARHEQQAAADRGHVQAEIATPVV